MFMQPPGSTDDSKAGSMTKEEPNDTEEHLPPNVSFYMKATSFANLVLKEYCEYLSASKIFHNSCFFEGPCSIYNMPGHTTSSNEEQPWVHGPWPRLHIICALHSRNRLQPAQGIDGSCKWTMSHRRMQYRDALSGIRWPSVLNLRIHPLGNF